MTRSITLEDIATMMEKGFGAVADDISSIRERVATKDDIEKLSGQIGVLHTQVNSIERELRDIKQRLTRLEDNVIGYREEIGDALERIAAIERHLGLNKRIAA